VVVTGEDRQARAVVVVLHHVVTDGVGGLALLARLLDPAHPSTAGQGGAAPGPAAPAAAATRGVDPPPAAETGRAVRAVRAVRTLRRGATELGLLGHGAHGAPRCSLNASPTGPRRRVAALDVDLDALRTAAHRYGATVNDVLLVATTGALGRLLQARGEDVRELVVSVPVSGRATGTPRDLGNEVGVMPVRVPLDGTPVERLHRVARSTRARRAGVRGSSSALIGPAFRLLVAVHLFRALIDRQRLVNTFLTNVRGPSTAGTLAGAPVLRAVPVTATAGNVSVAFAALSTAGTLTVSVIVDPDLVPEIRPLAVDLADELCALTTAATGPSRSAPVHAVHPAPPQEVFR
jgi:WS/DGAT/MGAT family acyltransferase